MFKGLIRAIRVRLLAEPLLFFIVLSLLALSFVMVYSTTGVMGEEQYGDSFYFVKRQLVGLVLGVIALGGASLIPLQTLFKISPYCYFFGIFLILLTFFPVIGSGAGGAQRWLDLKLIRFQPGELVKLCFVLYIASFFSRHEGDLARFATGVLKPLLLLSVFALLFLLQPDFGSVVVITFVTFVVGIGVGVRLTHVSALLGVTLLLALPIIALSPYRVRRITAFLDPFADPAGKGYQLIQSLIAIGSGGITGVGIGNSQQKLQFLPAAHTDFILSVIGEELGLIGCLVLLTLFALLLWRGIRLTQKQVTNTYTFALTLGLTAFLVIPAFLNMGVVTGLLPTKGMVLPLVGYGSSSMIASLLAVGLLFAIAAESKRAEGKKEGL